MWASRGVLAFTCRLLNDYLNALKWRDCVRGNKNYLVRTG